MASQKSSAVSAPVAPKRARGRARVAAILDAAAHVLAERGYDDATMTEVATRSGTAIGSLYRFFPTKLVLAEALMQRYVEEVGAALEAIEADAAALGALGIADALFAVIRGLRAERAAAVALLDVLDDAEGRRTMLRDLMRRKIASILRRASPDLGGAEAGVAARAVLQLLKGIRPLSEGPNAAAALAQWRIVLRLYLAEVISGA